MKAHFKGGILRLGQSASPASAKAISLPKLRRLVDTGSPAICITRSLGGIGDVLMSTPSLKAIKAEWPTAHLTYATDYNYSSGALKEILEHNPYINSIIPYQAVGGHNFDMVIDITSACVMEERRGGAHVANRIDLFANYIGIDLSKSGYLPVYEVTNAERDWAKKKMKTFRRNVVRPTWIGIQARSTTKRRAWPLYRVVQLAAALSQNPNYKVVIFDSALGFGDAENWNLMNVEVVKDYAFSQMAALLEQMDIVIAPDSGLLHLAGAFNKKIIAIFGSTDSRARINHYPNAVAVTRSLACSPCWYQECRSGFACLDIPAENVISVLKEIAQRPLLKPEAPVVEVVNLPKEEADPNPMDIELGLSNKLLINRCSGLGDIMMVTALAHTIKWRYPHIDITFRTNYPELLDGNTDIANVITGSLQEPVGPKLTDKFGYIIDLDYAVEPPTVCGPIGKCNEYDYMNTNRIELFYKQAGLRFEQPKLQYFPKKIELKEARDFISGMTGKKRIVYVMNCTSPTRTYPMVHSLAVISELVKQYSIIGLGTIFKVWGPDPWNHPLIKDFLDGTKDLDKNRFRYAKEKSLRFAIATLAESDLIITPDTGLLHVAAALDIPCIALFGNMPSDLRCKHYPNVHPIFSALPCSKDCGDRATYMRGNCPSWEVVHGEKRQIGAKCMENITPKSILLKVQEILNG